MSDKAWIAIIGDQRIACSAAVVEIYRRVFTEQPVLFVPADAQPNEAPE